MIKLKKTRTCNLCKAIYDRHSCGLNYKTKADYHPKWLHITNCRPLEECPKPLTNDNYIKCIDEGHKK